MTWIPLAAGALAVLGLALVVAGLRALWRTQLWRFTHRTLMGLLLLALGGLAGAIAVGVQNYQALTHEEAAARITVRPLGPQRFEADFAFADGRRARYELTGDEIYVDAHILKFKPLGNALGLHTLWEFDRVAGRYRNIEQERSGPRTVHSLAPERPVDLFDLRKRFNVFGPLFDAEYGSATFVPAAEPATFEVSVSTSGLLVRQVSDQAARP
ncbi:MAG: hypothetical protein R3E87_21535 [Burkholderiaceae bacterium]